MLIDIPQERGMTHADTKYGDEMCDVCQFPLFSVVKPLSADYMALLYTILFASKNGCITLSPYHVVIISFVSITKTSHF